MFDLRLKPSYVSLILCFLYIKKWRWPGIFMPQWTLALVIRLFEKWDVFCYGAAGKQPICPLLTFRFLIIPPTVHPIEL